MTASWPRLLQSFFTQYLAVERGLAENTLLSYRDVLKLLIDYLCDTLHKAPDEIQIEDLTQKRTLDFLDHGEQVRAWTPSTRNQRRAAIRTFWRYVAREHPELALQAMQVRSIGPKKTAPKPPEYRLAGVAGHGGPWKRMKCKSSWTPSIRFNLWECETTP